MTRERTRLIYKIQRLISVSVNLRFIIANVLTVCEILQCKAQKERIASYENIAVFRVNCDSNDLQLYMCCGLKSVNLRFIIAHADSLQLSTDTSTSKHSSCSCVNLSFANRC